MKTLFRRAAALLCAVLLCLSLVPPSGADNDASDSMVCFTAINNTLLPLGNDTMLVWIDSARYVPYTVFDDNTTGCDLGLYATYNRTDNTVTIYSLRKMLVFDLNAGNSYDANNQKVFSSKAVVRNGRIYVPLNLLKDFFSITYSHYPTDVAMLLRIKNENGNFRSDSEFADSAASMMTTRLKEYKQSPATPGTSAPPPPTTAGETDTRQGRLFLAFQCTEDGRPEEILTALNGQKVSALFLFSPEQLRGRDDLVRQLLGLGHTVGIASDGATRQEVLDDLEDGNHLLSMMAHTATSVVYCDGELWDALDGDDWVCWRESVDFRAGERETLSASQIAGTLPGAAAAPIYLTLDDSAVTAQTLSALLSLLEYQNYLILPPLETRL